MGDGMRRSFVILLLIGSTASADVVVERWGAGGRVQHPRTLTWKTLSKRAGMMRFDLSALPNGTRVYRARLVMFRAGRWDYSKTFTVHALAPRGEGKRGPELAPAPPYCRWFDVTTQVQRAHGARHAAGFLVSGAGYDAERTYLEIAYEGKLKDPPKPVSELRAFYRAGQVFLTWKEIEDLSEGRDRYAWGDLIKKVRGYEADGLIPDDRERELRYRVYVHRRPITTEAIGDAELLAEVVPGSGFNTRIVRRIWQGENRPSKLDDAFIAVRLAVRPEEPVGSGVGVYVHTCRKPGRRHYAVVTAVNGVENTVALGPGNVAGPIEQRPAPVEPALQVESVKKGRKPGGDLITRRYCLWAVPPLAPRPLQYGFVVRAYRKTLAGPAPLELSHGKAHTNEPELSRWQRKDAILLAGSADPKVGFYVGVNNCHETLKSFRQGTWGPWTWNRHKRLIDWMKATYRIDEQQVYCYGSHWGMWELRHPEIFSVFIGWGSAELTKGFVDWNRFQNVLGLPGDYAGKPREEDPYVMLNFTEFVKADPRRRLPVQFLVPCTGSHTSEMSYPALPRYKRALMDARQPFAAAVGKASWGFRVPAALRAFRAGRLKLRRDQSVPAFGNGTLDDNPGNGDYRNGESVGLINGHLLWQTEDIVDTPEEWRMTVYLDGSAPLGTCGVDLTPRHCRRFAPRRNQEFRWTNTSLESGNVVQSGTVRADRLGLVTLTRLTVSKGKNRIAIVGN
jgi:hypothetical protein